jgi:hypothetical protein
MNNSCPVNRPRVQFTRRLLTRALLCLSTVSLSTVSLSSHAQSPNAFGTPTADVHSPSAAVTAVPGSRAQGWMLQGRSEVLARNGVVAASIADRIWFWSVPISVISVRLISKWARTASAAHAHLRIYRR